MLLDFICWLNKGIRHQAASTGNATATAVEFKFKMIFSMINIQVRGSD